MKYEVVTHEELLGLRSSLSVIERVLESSSLDLHFYGITSNTAVLAKAEDALEEESEVGEEQVKAPKLVTIAVAIPLTSDTVHYLVGSGLILRKEKFAYIGDGDGARTSDFGYSTSQARVTDEDFEEIAVADGDDWIDDFLVKHRPGQAAQAHRPVTRSQEATRSEDLPKTGSLKTSSPIDLFLRSK